MMSLLKPIKRILALSLVVFVLMMSGATYAADKYPTWRGAVIDFANIIDSANASKIESLFREVLQKTGTAVVIATVETVGENEDAQSKLNIQQSGPRLTLGVLTLRVL